MTVAAAEREPEWAPISGIDLPLPGSAIDIGGISFTEGDCIKMMQIISEIGELEFAKLVLKQRVLDTASVQILISYLRGERT